MSQLLYTAGLKAYSLLLQASAPFHAKAGKMVAGRRRLFEQLEQRFEGNTHPVAWFHCASLGEFEQGRPVIEKFSAEHPEYKILLTFFSSSGYEIRKNYAGAHYIFYLPLDSAGNAQRFLDITRPSLAIFVKYEFWYYYLRELHQRQIPVFSISAIFRPNQLFFKPYGGFYRDILKLFNHIFTQNQASVKLLLKAGITQASAAGDTRFDRVLQTAASVKNIPVVEAFKGDKPIFVVGSSWPQDMEILLPLIQKFAATVKFIVAPHEIHAKELDSLVTQLSGQAIKYSQATPENAGQYHVLLIDNIGMLSSLYSYGTYGYIGGAFGKGLHNTLEAAVFGLPLFFGPVYTKFQEAIDLVRLQVAFPINTSAEMEAIFADLLVNPARVQEISERAKAYVRESAGATEIILQHVQKRLKPL